VNFDGMICVEFGYFYRKEHLWSEIYLNYYTWIYMQKMLVTPFVMVFFFKCHFLPICLNIVHLHPVAHCYYTFTFFFRLCAACHCLKHFIVFSTLITL
jgi:hypothetical protein